MNISKHTEKVEELCREPRAPGPRSRLVFAVLAWSLYAMSDASEHHLRGQLLSLLGVEAELGRGEDGSPPPLSLIHLCGRPRQKP